MHMSRRLLVVLTMVAALAGACRRETTTTEVQGTGDGATVTATTLTGEPQDLSNAKVNTVLSPDTGLYVVTSRVGTSLGPEGVVVEEKAEVGANEEVYLSLWLKESPPGLQTSAILEDSDGKEVDVERKAMKGEKTVSFALGDRKLKPGTYKITGYWGGNVASEHDLTVTAAAKPPAKSKAKSKS